MHNQQQQHPHEQPALITPQQCPPLLAWTAPHTHNLLKRSRSPDSSSSKTESPPISEEEYLRDYFSSPCPPVKPEVYAGLRESFKKIRVDETEGSTEGASIGLLGGIPPETSGSVLQVVRDYAAQGGLATACTPETIFLASSTSAQRPVAAPPTCGSLPTFPLRISTRTNGVTNSASLAVDPYVEYSTINSLLRGLHMAGRSQQESYDEEAGSAHGGEQAQDYSLSAEQQPYQYRMNEILRQLHLNRRNTTSFYQA